MRYNAPVVLAHINKHGIDKTGQRRRATAWPRRRWQHKKGAVVWGLWNGRREEITWAEYPGRRCLWRWEHSPKLWPICLTPPPSTTSKPFSASSVTGRPASLFSLSAITCQRQSRSQVKQHFVLILYHLHCFFWMVFDKKKKEMGRS